MRTTIVGEIVVGCDRHLGQPSEDRSKDYGIGRVSALLTEAWAAGTPVIVSGGWWGAEQGMRYGGGLVFEFGNIPSFAQCVREVLSDREDFARLAVDAFRRLSRDDGPAAFVKWVLNRCDPSAGA